MQRGATPRELYKSGQQMTVQLMPGGKGRYQVIVAHDRNAECQGEWAALMERMRQPLPHEDDRAAPPLPDHHAAQLLEMLAIERQRRAQ